MREQHFRAEVENVEETSFPSRGPRLIDRGCEAFLASIVTTGEQSIPIAIEVIRSVASTLGQYRKFHSLSSRNSIAS